MENNNADEENIPKLPPGSYPPIFHPLAFVVLISFGITDPAVVFVSIWYNYTTNEKALWLDFDAAFIKFPKVLEFIVYDCQM